MQNGKKISTSEFIHARSDELVVRNAVDAKLYSKFDIKRGLRNADGTGVLAGITHICNVRGYYILDDERVPTEGGLTYRGIEINDLVNGFTQENRFGYEETAFLILFGYLPKREELEAFNEILTEYRRLPDRFAEDIILPSRSRDIMNTLARSVLALYSYDDNPEPDDIETELKKALKLVARCPVMASQAYAAKKHYIDHEGLYLHSPQPELSLAENFLYSIRRDGGFSEKEAHLLDLCMVLHAEHGGGNNSTFTCRSLTSTGTDMYSAIAGAICALKGPKHGGANMKVMEMFDYIKDEVKDWKDDDEIRACLGKILNKEGGDHSGLIYGMGHAIYTKSDPRAVILKSRAHDVAEEKGMSDEFALLESVERLGADAFQSETGHDKVISANVDMYSGMVYHMLGIEKELFTPLFAISRIAGWCAHRIEELYNPNRLIRPAYKVIAPRTKFIPMSER